MYEMKASSCTGLPGSATKNHNLQCVDQPLVKQSICCKPFPDLHYHLWERIPLFWTFKGVSVSLLCRSRRGDAFGEASFKWGPPEEILCKEDKSSCHCSTVMTDMLVSPCNRLRTYSDPQSLWPSYRLVSMFCWGLASTRLSVQKG